MPYRHRMVFGAFCVAMLTGCASATEAHPAPEAGGADAPERQAQRIQSAIADCMKRQGFKCVAWVPEENVSDEFEKSSSGDYEAMRKERELNGDPRLVELAATMGDCLKGRGYRVDSLKPVDLDRRGAAEFEAQKRAIALKDDIPEQDMPEGRYYEPRLPQATAKQYFTREIKAALDDLECGRDFYPVYHPRKRAISIQVGDQFGGGES
ncbi:hypothetical protein [Nonomuraea fuscirosea]|uniref:hypothetical protein n=1 Tax=Nonomuraea fuscirosea TaxID=1291556 RepID=UPI00343B615F